MKIVIQRVNRASVTVKEEVISTITRGLLCYVSYAATDDDATMRWAATKITGLRIFPAETGTDRFDRSVQEIGGEILVVTNFTLHADCRKGRRPDFISAASPAMALELHNRFVAILRETDVKVRDGRFGAHMLVESENDGPVTLILDRE